MTWRFPDREDRQVAALWAACAILAIVLRPLWLAAATVLPSCPWRLATGWPCPGCGTTRAIVRLLHADVPGALALNPLATFAALTFVTGGSLAPVWLACGGRIPEPSAGPKPLGFAALAGAVLANWAWLVARGV